MTGSSKMRVTHKYRSQCGRVCLFGFEVTKEAGQWCEMRKKKRSKLVIKARDLKVSTGHHLHDQGCGRHDSRPRRDRTRSSQRRQWMKEWE